jgi:hypothetical protein
LGVGGGVVHLLADGLEAAQVVMLAEPLREVAALLGVVERHDADVVQDGLGLLGGHGEGRLLCFHAGQGKKSADGCPVES